MKTLQVKCPNCGAVLSIKVNNYEACVDKILACMVCKTRNRLGDYTIYVPEEEADETHVVVAAKETIGTLTDLSTGKEYQLKEGHNTFGRKTYKTESKASLPIETEDTGMSRLHANLEVMKGRDGRYHVYVSNLQNMNRTYINGELLEDGDQIALQDGDIIMTSLTKLRYNCGSCCMAEDDDKTELPS